MAKTTRHGGASSNAGTVVTAPQGKQEGGGQPSGGNSSETSTEKPQTSSETSRPRPRKRAQTTGHRSPQGRTGSSTAGSTATSGPATDG